MIIGKSEFKIANHNGKIFVDHFYNDELIDTMKVYGLNAAPYCKRMGTKMYIKNELMDELKSAIG